MTNLAYDFIGEWANGLGPNYWVYHNMEDLPEVDEETGILTLHVGGQTGRRIEGPVDTRGGTSGWMQTETGEEYAVQTTVKTTEEMVLQLHLMDDDFRDGSLAETEALVPAGVPTVIVAGPAREVTATGGGAYILFGPLSGEGPGSIEVMPFWAGKAADMPAPDEWPGDDVEVTAEAPQKAGNLVTVPEVEGVIYEPPAGSYELTEAEPTLTVTAEAAEGYVLDGDPQIWTFNYDDEGDDDEGDDEDDKTAAELAPKVAAYVGARGDGQVEATAEGQLPVIIEFVRGYTRGQGFNSRGRPNAALRACIVSACARLVMNPEQVRQYSAGNYSESPAILQGFSLIEQQTLNNYRRRWV